MYKYLTVAIFFIWFTQAIKSQEVSNTKDIIGRWVEVKRIEGDSTKLVEEYPDTYIFRDNMIFHKGEAAEGVILFNITGKYSIEDNNIVIFYNDYIQRGVANQKAKKIVFEILSITQDEMQVMVHDYDYEYKMILKR